MAFAAAMKRNVRDLHVGRGQVKFQILIQLSKEGSPEKIQQPTLNPTQTHEDIERVKYDIFLK